ncbi:MAG TPA: SRPBCC family protein [Actinomycetota bacterium]|jgi:hypothetical protein
MIAAGAVTWSLVAVSAVLVLLLILLVGAWLLGRLTIDLGWGRTRHPLGPIELLIDAPRGVVFDVVASPYLSRTPRELRGELEVLERGSDLVVAAHHTRLSLLTSTTVETVRFEAPDRISFRLLRGVAPSVTEEFTFEETDAGTVMAYRGQLAMDFWVFGRVAGRFLVKPTWEKVVRRHLGDVKAIAEERGQSLKDREP